MKTNSNQKKKKEKLNIVQLFYARPHLGGSGIMSMELTKQLQKRGHNLHVVSYPGTYLTPEEIDLGIKIHPIEMVDYACFKAEPFNATLASQIANIYEEFNVDIIHANYAITHGEAALTAKRIIQRKGGNPKVIVTSHGSDIHTNGHHKLLAHSIEDTLLCADEITFVSSSLQNEAKSLFNLKNYGSVIYNFVDEKRFCPIDSEQKIELKKQLGIPLNKTIIYHASNFRPVKNTDILVDAAAILEKNKYKNKIHFVLLGEGPNKLNLEEKVNFTKNLSEMFTFVGKKDDVLPYIQASDIGILPSQRESFGLALLESMSCGTPVIGSDVGGIPEVIEHNHDGFITQYNNVDDIVHYIEKLHGDINLREKMGLNARHSVLHKFSREVAVDKYEDLYFNLLKK